METNPLSRADFFVPRLRKLRRGVGPEVVQRVAKGMGFVAPRQMVSVLGHANGGMVCSFVFLGVGEPGSPYRPPQELDMRRRWEDHIVPNRGTPYWSPSWIPIGSDGIHIFVLDAATLDSLDEGRILAVIYAGLGEPGAVKAFATGYYEFVEKCLDEEIKERTPDGEYRDDLNWDETSEQDLSTDN